MSVTNIDPQRFDKLAKEATGYVFDFMIDEKVEFIRDSSLVGKEERQDDLFLSLLNMNDGYFSIAVGYVGDAEGQIILTLSRSLAERFTLKLLDMPSLDWAGEDTRETIVDVMGELGNSYVGLVKGALTKNFPNLMLTTPVVQCSSRIGIDESELGFRKQYLFSSMGFPLLVDICHK